MWVVACAFPCGALPSGCTLFTSWRTSELGPVWGPGCGHGAGLALWAGGEEPALLPLCVPPARCEPPSSRMSSKRSACWFSSLLGVQVHTPHSDLGTGGRDSGASDTNEPCVPPIHLPETKGGLVEGQQGPHVLPHTVSPQDLEGPEALMGLTWCLTSATS